MNANGNGSKLIRMDRRGIQSFQFSDADPPFSVDVIEVYNLWRMRSEPYYGPFKPDGTRECKDIAGYYAGLQEFVQEVCKHPVSKADAATFMAHVERLQRELGDFFVATRGDVSSSHAPQGSTASTSTPGAQTFSGVASDGSTPGNGYILETVPQEN